MNANLHINKKTFWEIISDYTIEIPIIQRDYAQGRSDKNAQRIRELFIDALYRALKDGISLELDFVYGTKASNCLQFIDGQQRITTLFLLYWYIANKEGKSNEIKNVLSKFTYETRASAREFCQEIVSKDLTFNNNKESYKTLSAKIEDQPWFFLEWKKDMTILPMLTMIDSIHDRFKDLQEPLWDKLSNISFSFLVLEHFGLSDDLYIKMNARGKMLTHFEIFKARMYSWIQQNKWENDISDPKERFDHNIDTKWTDLFWKYKDPQYKIDDRILKFMSNIAVIDAVFQQNSEDSTTHIHVLIDQLNETDKYKNLTPEHFRTKESIERLKIYFDVYAKIEMNSNMAIELWDLVHKITATDIVYKIFYSNINTSNTTSYKTRVLLYAQSEYLQKIEKVDHSKFLEWIRVVRNIIENSTIDAFSAFASCLTLIKELSKGCDSIYQYLSKLNIEPVFSKDQINEEIQKSILICNNDELKKIFFELEDTAFCKGTIAWCINCCLDNDKLNIEKLRKIKSIIDSHLYINNGDISNDFRRGLFTIDDNKFYNYWSIEQPNSSWTSKPEAPLKRFLIQDSQDLKKNFATIKPQKQDWFTRYFKPLIQQLFDQNIQDIVSNYHVPDDMPEWKQLLIRDTDWLNKNCKDHHMIALSEEETKCFLFPKGKRMGKSVWENRVEVVETPENRN